MFANKFFFIKRIDLNRAIAISFILHILVFYSDLFFNGFKLPKKQDITFEAVLLTQKNITQEKAVPFEEVKKMDTETKIPEPDAVPLNKKKIEEKIIPRNQTAVPEMPKNLPQPQKEIQKPGEDDIRNKGLRALDQFSMLFAQHIGKFKKYPEIAQSKGWQGETIMEVKLKGDGTVFSASIRKSSGFRALDDEALEMLKRGVPYPTPPEILKDRTFTIFVPIRFALY
jgi:protein TonB